MNHPGFEPDLVVTTDSVSMMRVFAGLDELASARARGTVRIDGPRALVAAFPTWFTWSPFRAGGPGPRGALATLRSDAASATNGAERAGSATVRRMR